MSRYDDEWDPPEWEYSSGRRSPYPAPERPRRRVPARLPQEKLVAIARARNESLKPQDGRNPRQKGRDRSRRRESITRKLLPFFRRSSPVVEPEYISYPARSRNGGYRYVPAISPDEPLLDIRSVVRAAYDSRRLIALLLLLGMIGGGAATLMLSRKYTAQSSLYFDPMQIQFNFDGQSQSSATAQSAAAFINSQIRILTSNAVLQNVVEKLSLTNDPEFAGADAGSAAPYAVASSLKKAVTTLRDDNSYIVALNVTTHEPAKSAEIANAIVTSFLDYENKSVSELYSGINTALDQRLVDLSKKVHAAETAVDDYRAKNDMVTAKGDLISESRLAALNDALVEAQQKTIEAMAKVDAAKRLSLADAVAGMSDSEVTSATLVDLRRQYAVAASNLGRLESQLGSRHPSLTAAKASLDGLRAEINKELKRIASVAQTELSQAKKAEQDIAKELAAQKALKLSNTSNQAELNNLELQATAARNIYEAVLKKTRETNEERNITQSNVRVIEKAEPPTRANGPGRSVLLVAGVIGGAFFGFGAGLFFAIMRRLVRHPLVRSYFAPNGYS